VPFQDSDSVTQIQCSMEVLIWCTSVHFMAYIHILFKALVNIPVVSNKTIRHDIAASKTTTDSRIQVSYG